jgi:hypothetical protein
MKKESVGGSSRLTVKRKKKAVKADVKKTIPRRYGKSRIVLMPRDPFWTFAYWEVTRYLQNRIKNEYGREVFKKSRLILRVYDVDGKDFYGNNSKGHFDIDINPFADNWYIQLPETNRNICVELGIVLPDGTFVAMLRSNVVSMPRTGVSPITDEQWGVHQKEFEQILKLSGIEEIGKSSVDIMRFIRDRWNQFLTSNLPSSPSAKDTKNERVHGVYFDNETYVRIWKKTMN